MAEGVKGFIFNQFNGLASSPDVQKGVFKATEKLDYSEYGGAPVLGARGIVIKCHGRSKAKALTNAIKLTAGFIKGRLNDLIVAELHKLSAWSTSWFSNWFSWSKEDE
jgi:glycerol-3-phosphate acyltransferase PlsX